jgi:uncharacterized DUF497 family protein
MRIDFDPKKNEVNVRTRGLSFEKAASFDFDSAVVFEDVRHSYPEARFIALGFLDSRLHVMCFTPTEQGIRVISFRKANQREVRDYEQTSALN